MHIFTDKLSLSTVRPQRTQWQCYVTLLHKVKLRGKAVYGFKSVDTISYTSMVQSLFSKVL